MAWERAIEHEAKKMHEQGYRPGHVNEWAKAKGRMYAFLTQDQEKRHGPCTDEFPRKQVSESDL
jgi:hypothetical protein